MYRVFAVMRRCVFSAFLNLKKAYDTIDRNAMWQISRMWGVMWEILNPVQSFYVESRAYVRVGTGV